MSDRSSCRIFSDLFIECAKINDETAKKIAAKLWSMQKSYDFFWTELQVEEEIRKLGIDPDIDYPAELYPKD